MNWSDESDCILDDALAEYREAEPLSGLEERVLRRLETQGQARHTSIWGRLGIAVAMAAMLLAGWTGWRHSAAYRPSAPAAAVRPAISQGEADDRGPSKAVNLNRHPEERGVRATLQPRRIAQPFRPDAAPVKAYAADAGPRLAQFPSPVPLTAEERAAIAMVKHDPGLIRDSETKSSDKSKSENEAGGMPDAPSAAKSSEQQVTNDDAKNSKIQINPIEIIPLPDEPTGGD